MKTLSITIEVDIDIRGEVTEKKLMKLMRTGDDTKFHKPNFVNVSIDGVPNESFREMFNREIKKDMF